MKLPSLNIFSKKKEKRSAPVATTGGTWLDTLIQEGLTGMFKSNKIAVTPESSLKHAAVWACVRIIAESLATLPLQIYEKTDDKKQTAKTHPLYNLLHKEPSQLLTAFEFIETMQMHLCLWGNAYAEIIRVGNTASSLNIIQPWEVLPVLQDGYVYYKTKGRIIEAKDMLHIKGISFDGIQGLSPIAYQRESIGLGLSAQKFGLNFFENGANVGSVLEHPGTLQDPSYKRLKESFEDSYAGIVNSGKPLILEGGMKFTRMAIPPAESQFIENRKFSVTDIARIFRVPPHMIADLERSTYSNIEHQGIEFVKYTVTPWAVRWEQELNRKLLKESEKSNHFFEFNMEGFLRGDAKARAEFYSGLFNIGAVSQNEIRAKENLNPAKNGDKYYVPLNMIPSDKVDQYIDSLTNNSDGKRA